MLLEEQNFAALLHEVHAKFDAGATFVFFPPDKPLAAGSGIYLPEQEGKQPWNNNQMLDFEVKPLLKSLQLAKLGGFPSQEYVIANDGVPRQLDVVGLTRYVRAPERVARLCKLAKWGSNREIDMAYQEEARRYLDALASTPSGRLRAEVLWAKFGSDKKQDYPQFLLSNPAANVQPVHKLPYSMRRQPPKFGKGFNL